MIYERNHSQARMGFNSYVGHFLCSSLLNRKEEEQDNKKYYLGLILGLKSAIITFKEVITENYIGRQSKCYNIFTVSQMYNVLINGIQTTYYG